MAFWKALMFVIMEILRRHSIDLREPPTVPPGNANSADLDLVKAFILQKLHLDHAPPPKSRIHDKVLRDRLQWEYAHSSFDALKVKGTAIYILPQTRSTQKHDEDMTFEFHFRLQAFESKVVSNATFNMYKNYIVGGSAATTIAVAEVLGQSRHEINAVVVKSDVQDWISIDITNHVQLWVRDFDNGEAQVRVLQLYCIYCLEKLSTDKNGLLHPYIKVDLLDAM